MVISSEVTSLLRKRSQKLSIPLCASGSVGTDVMLSPLINEPLGFFAGIAQLPD
jgi:hypothetical protein